MDSNRTADTAGPTVAILMESHLFRGAKTLARLEGGWYRLLYTRMHPRQRGKVPLPTRFDLPGRGHATLVAPLFVLLFVQLFAIVAEAQPPAAKKPRPSCDLVFEGEVQQGQNFTHPGPGKLDFMLEWIDSGWIVRLLEHGVPRTAYDYAGIATPPYLSPNPILITTDFSFRAQDAVGWNPRSFQYFRTAAEMQDAVKAYQEYMAAPPKHPTPASQAAMARLVALTSAAAPASLQILDAHLSGGTNNQTLSASLVASHFLTTPHVMDDPQRGGATPLGALHSLRFRVTFPGAISGCKTR